MAVVPFRPRQQPRVPQRCAPDVPALARACASSHILLFLSPWLMWLDILRNDGAFRAPEDQSYD